LSTITDLFSIRIGFGRKGIFVEKLKKNINILTAEEKLPLKEGLRVARYNNEPIEEILDKEGITKETVYYILHPSLYYRNTLRFPFHDRQKIEGIIKFEVQEYLPSPEIDYTTDFFPFWVEPSVPSPNGHEVLSFTTDKVNIINILDNFGRYRENLKALIPFDIAVFYCSVSIIDKPAYIFIDIQDGAIYMQYVKGLKIHNVIFINKYSDEQYKNSLTSQLLMLLKISDFPSVYINMRTSVDEDFRRLNNQIFNELDLSYRSFPVHQYGDSLETDQRIDYSELISIFGTLNSINQPPHKRVNLLKEEFKPRLKGYIRLKDFVAVGALLLVLLLISLSNLFIEIHFQKSQIEELKGGMDELSMKVFEKPQLKGKEAEQYLKEIQQKIDFIENTIDRRFSGTELLREISTFLPDDVVIEYTDIIIERNHIKFSGKARTFSDIDRIKESLAISEYVSEVKVSNTGTTGSSEGFAVTFLFDITIKEKI